MDNVTLSESASRHKTASDGFEQSDHPEYSFQRDGSLFNPLFVEHRSFEEGQFSGYAVIAELIAKLPSDGAPSDTMDGLLTEAMRDYLSDAPTHEGRRGAAATVVYLVTEIMEDAIFSGRAEAVFRRAADAFFQMEQDQIDKGRAKINALLPQPIMEPEIKRSRKSSAKTQEVTA